MTNLRLLRSGRVATRTTSIVALSLLLGACAGFDSVEDTGTRYLAAYRPFSSCDDLAAWTRDAMRDQVTAWGLGGGVVPVLGAVRGEAAVAGDAVTSSAGAPSTSTNVQEAGIDEGDLAENDGRYVYLAVDQRLRVVDTVTGDVAAEETIPAGEHQLVLETASPGNGNLVLVTGTWNGTGSETQVRRYRVENASLTATGVEHLEGQLTAVRAIAGAVHIVLRHDTAGRLPFVAPTTSSPEAEAEALATNRRIIEELDADDILPRTFRVDADGNRDTPTSALACERIGTPGEYSGLGMTWVATVDIDADGAAARAGAAVVADAEHVYASADALYVATVRSPQPDGPTAPIRPEPVRTNVHRFDLTATGAQYRASGSVAGRIISPYSLSAHRDLLRVATTTEAAGFGSESMSGIRLLETRGDELVQISEVDGLGLGEQIQGVRFSGDLAFVVTFRQIDPLYTVDLTDPANPRVRGELKIPGFSTWLLALGDGRLLAFGRSGTDDGAITGVQWSLFDVADLENPQLVSTLAAGENSEAAWNPHALAYEPTTGLLLTPGETWNLVAEPLPVPGLGRLDGTTIAPAGNWYVNVGRLDQAKLLDMGRVQLQAPARRVMLVGGRIVSVNSDGSVTIADAETLEVLANA